MDKHQKAWKLYKARPKGAAKDKVSTNVDWCIYHAAHGDYTYSDKWIEFLVEEIKDDEKWQKICAKVPN